MTWPEPVPSGRALAALRAELDARGIATAGLAITRLQGTLTLARGPAVGYRCGWLFWPAGRLSRDGRPLYAIHQARDPAGAARRLALPNVGEDDAGAGPVRLQQRGQLVGRGHPRVDEVASGAGHGAHGWLGGRAHEIVVPLAATTPPARAPAAVTISGPLPVIGPEHGVLQGHRDDALCRDSARAGVTASVGCRKTATVTPPPPALAGL